MMRNFARRPTDVLHRGNPVQPGNSGQAEWVSGHPNSNYRCKDNKRLSYNWSQHTS